MKNNYTQVLVLTSLLCCTQLMAQSGKSSAEVKFNTDYMDKNVKAEDDFFLYANGTWVKNNPVPPTESRWGSFNELDQANQKKLTKILEDLKSGNFAKGSSEQLLSAYYSSYMNMEKRNQLGISPIQKELDRVNGITNYGDLASIVAEHHRVGVRSLFRFDVDQDLKEVTKNISSLSQGGLGLPNKDFYIKENKKEILAKYQDYLVKIGKLAGLNEKMAQAMAAMSVAFEGRLAKHMMSPAELRVPENSYHKMTKKEAEALFSNFDFDKYLSQLGSQTFENIVIGQPEFVIAVNGFIKTVSIEEWKAYLYFRVLNHYAGYLDEKFVQEKFNFFQGVLSGKTQMKPINERAIDELTRMSIGEALGKLFVEQHYSQKAQQRVNVMVDNLLLTFDERIRGLSWMSDSTKKEALHKLNAISRKLGFPTKWEDFSDLNLDKDTYLANVKRCNERDVQKGLMELYKPIDKERWGMPAHMVNAYYNPLLNEIAFPAGIMQPPFFDANAEDALNYGRIGMVIGHEFTHGFDDEGSKFAADGTFENWWSEADRKAFEEKTGTLGATFSEFCPIDGHCVNPELTMGENIADLGGITLAYYAYTKTEEFKSGKKVDGFTPAQRFFLSFAQLWKINYTEAEMKNRIATDPHSPGMYRVNGPLMNCPEFFEAFQIPEGAKMRNSGSKLAKIW